MNKNVELPLPPLPESVNAGRVPTWDLASVCHRPCPVCRGDMPQFVCCRPDHLRVARCPECEMVYLPEIPSSEEISRFYERYAIFKRFTPRKLSWWQLHKASLSNSHIAILKHTGGLDNASLTEVGCSFGHFLQVAKHCGAEVTGIELDKDARSQLSSLGIASQEAFQEGQKVDIVCAFQLVEHLANPGALFAQISDALVDDGRLLLALPNGGEFENVGESWVGFRVDLEHLNYFSVKSLSRLLAQFNLVVEQFWLQSQPEIARAKTKNVWPKPIWRRLASLPDKFLARLYHSQNCIDGSFDLTVLARKTSANDS